ncbi:MAG: DUF6788 family protein [Candidatus Dormibacteria bacterium]
MSSRPSALDVRLHELEQRHRACLAAIADCGLVLPGSVGTYTMRCSNLGCHCRADPSTRHGPYTLWTRKVAGKSITIRPGPDKAAQFKEWNRNMRRLSKCVQELQALGVEAAQALLDAS